jgi:hypothetical protein
MMQQNIPEMGFIQRRTQRALRRFRYLLLDADFQFIEAWSALMGVWWGTWALMPFDSFSGNSAFRAMAWLAPEWLWGVVFATGGLMQLSNVLHERHRARMLTAFIGSVSWMFAGFMFVAGNYTTPSTVLYFGLAMAEAWCYLRLSIRQKVTDGLDSEA